MCKDHFNHIKTQSPAEPDLVYPPAGVPRVPVDVRLVVRPVPGAAPAELCPRGGGVPALLPAHRGEPRGDVPVRAPISSIRRFVITEKAPTRAFSWLKDTIKTLC